MGAAAIYALKRGGLPLLPASSALSAVHWWTVPGYLLLVAVSSYFRGARWRLLLRPIANVSHWRALSAVLVGSAAILVLPLRLGEMARPLLIARDGRISPLSALSSVIAERIIDGLVLSSILGIALMTVPTIVPLPEQVLGMPVTVAAVRGYAWTFLIGFGGAFVVIVIFHAARELSVKLVRATLGRIAPRLAELATSLLERFSSGLDFLRHRGLALQFMLETAVYWACVIGAYWLLGWGTGVVHADGSGMGFGEACAIMGMVGMASALPGPPGLIGLFQAGVYAAMTMYFPSQVLTGAGSVYVFLLYTLQTGFTLVAGLACFLLTKAPPVVAALEPIDPKT
jgi:hypothetical protein